MKKRNRFVRFGLVFTVLMSLLLSSCSSDDISRKTFPLSADIFHSVDGKKVAFQGLTHSAVSWSWDFGDGATSSEQNPVHIYQDGGYYVAILTVTDKNGNTEVTEVKMAIALTPYILLTGGPTAINGKTWKLSAGHSGNGDYLAWANDNLDTFDPDITPLPDGAFGLFLGMGEVYDDEFTFHFDGSYGIDVKDDAAFSGVFYAMATVGPGGVKNWGGIDFGLVTSSYSPADNASFTFVEDEDFTNLSVFGAITYNDVSTLDFSGTSFLGFLDFQRKVIVQELTDKSMKIVVFASLDEDAAAAGGYSTNALIISLEVVE